MRLSNDRLLRLHWLMNSWFWYFLRYQYTASHNLANQILGVVDRKKFIWRHKKQTEAKMETYAYIKMAKKHKRRNTISSYYATLYIRIFAKNRIESCVVLLIADLHISALKQPPTTTSVPASNPPPTVVPSFTVSRWAPSVRHLSQVTCKYEYEIFIIPISQRNVGVHGNTSIKTYGYKHTTNKLQHKAMIQSNGTESLNTM